MYYITKHSSIWKFKFVYPRRHQRETEALKDVLASYQNNADNDVAHKISEYETTIADYEVSH